MSNVDLDLAIVGAGPIGLDAATRALECGLEFVVLEKHTVGHHLKQWHDVQMFTHFEMNRSESQIRLAQNHRLTVPSNARYHEGPEFVSEWLEPLAHKTPLDDHIITGTRVRSITRQNQMKNDNLGQTERTSTAFRLITDNPDQSVVIADTVLDATGTFGQPSPVGTGGVKAPGENQHKNRIERGFPTERTLQSWAGQQIMLVGAGYSAATNALRLGSIQQDDPSMSVSWLVRHSDGQPVGRLDEDPLPKRDSLARQANRLASDGMFDLIDGAEIDRLISSESGLTVKLTDNSTHTVDRILANVGHRPNRSIYRELQFHECYATEGPIDLAATLLDQDSGDCLDVDPGGVETLKTPEPNFYVIGSKSYGRNSNFLLETGFAQVNDLFQSPLLEARS